MIRLLLPIVLVAVSYCDIINYENSAIEANTVNLVRRFVFINKTDNYSDKPFYPGVNVSLFFEYKPNKNWIESFNFYLLKSGSVPNVDISSSNPAICCSDKGGVICDDYFQYFIKKTNDTESRFLKTYSAFSYEYTINPNYTDFNFTFSKNISDEGVYYGFLMFCSTKIVNNTTSSANGSVSLNETLILNEKRVGTLNGMISFFNSDGYLSGDSFYALQLYLFLCLIYFIFGLFWFYKFIIFYSALSLYQTLISITVPIIIFECLINLQIYSEINNTGSVGKIFVILTIISNLIKNTFVRLILYGLSVGFKIYVSMVSKKKIMKISVLLTGYLVFQTTFQILYENYKMNLISFAYILLSTFFLLLINVWIFYKIFKGVRHYFEYAQYHNDNINFNLYGNLKKILLISGIAFCTWILLELYYPLILSIFSVINNDSIWYLKWVGDYLLEFIYIFFYLTVFFVLLPNSETQKPFGYQEEIDEEVSQHVSQPGGNQKI